MKRRDLLTQAALAGALLPQLGHSAGAAQPKVLMLFLPSGMPVAAPNSQIQDNDPLYWHRNDFSELSWIQSPLRPYRSDLLLFKNLRIDPDSQFNHRMRPIWSGSLNPQASSLDHQLARMLGRTQPLNLGCFLPTKLDDQNCLTFGDAGRLVQPMTSPQQVFDSHIQPALTKAQTTARSRLQAWQRQLQAPGAGLSADLANRPNQSSREADQISQANPYIKPVIRAQMRNLVAALKLGITPVGSLQISYPANQWLLDFAEINQLYTELGLVDNGNLQKRNHAASHSGDRRIHAAQCHWLIQQVAYLLQLLRRERLLDSTLVLVSSSTADAQSHHELDAPWFIAGGKDFIQTGRQLDCQNTGHGAVLSGIAQALSVNWQPMDSSSPALRL